ncbi:hypothetical protein RhiirC2_803297 [Rhizophagus irregularis]|uniref:DUF8211 domain-containing protein n=1 Tax=Rhizophagus irregularis TaxID=588596 RepID=A0A2N1LPY9_9GLOM|nr:hypothetical protein RhiirC2_803297 [Rhizophagus irregularis]
MDTHPNTKRFHATHLSNNWNKRTIKHIYSQRLGISYNSQYLANDVRCIHASERRMYRKRLDNLRTQHTTDNKTSKRQKLRFERACRSIFNNRGALRDSHVSADNIEKQLHRARQHRFLFLPLQYIYKPLQHEIL